MRRKNDIYSTVAGHKNLNSGAPFNNKTKRAGTDRLRFEDVDPESFSKQLTNQSFGGIRNLEIK